jgi:hypothetical protein
MSKPNIDRDSRVVITKTGGFAGQSFTIADLTLDYLSDDDFKTVKSLINKLAAKNDAQQSKVFDGFTYEVSVGGHSADLESLSAVFNSKSVPAAPADVVKLQKILAPQRGGSKRSL